MATVTALLIATGTLLVALRFTRPDRWPWRRVLVAIFVLAVVAAVGGLLYSPSATDPADAAPTPSAREALAPSTEGGAPADYEPVEVAPARNREPVDAVPEDRRETAGEMSGEAP